MASTDLQLIFVQHVAVFYCQVPIHYHVVILTYCNACTCLEFIPCSMYLLMKCVYCIKTYSCIKILFIYCIKIHYDSFTMKNMNPCDHKKKHNRRKNKMEYILLLTGCVGLLALIGRLDSSKPRLWFLRFPLFPILIFFNFNSLWSLYEQFDSKIR